LGADSITCANCRHEMAANALFCPHCGRAKVRDDGDVLLGKVLGDRFLVVDRLGQGASGTIYRAEHVTLRRRVAIKVLHHELSRDDLALERFRREATTVADIDNEHIVEIHDFGRTFDGRLYLAMELLEGETLDAVLAREQRLPIDRVVDVMTQVGEALIEAHAIGYIHRDLRPRNIFLAARRGRPNFVKILDFGLSKIVEKEGHAASTSLGMTFGDPRYMSPEQARGDAIDRRADLYQLGCVAYEMLTGAPPFTGGRVFDVLSRHVSEAPAGVISKRADVPAWLDAIVMRLLAKQPDERFATMSRMVEALRLGAQSGAVMPAATARTEEAEPPPSVSRVMQKLGRTALGPHGDDDAARAQTELAPPKKPEAAPVDDDAPTRALPKLGPRGTPRVGVPVVTATEPVVPPPSAAAPPQAPWQRPKHDARNDAKVQPAAETRADGIAGGYNPASPSVPSAAGGPPAMPDRSNHDRPAHDRPAGSAGSTGKLPAGRTKRPSAGDSAGISSVWYADGDKLDGGDDLDESQAAKLDRARRLIGVGDSMSDGYAPPRRPLGKYLAIGGGAIALVVVVAIALAGGGDDKAEKAKDTPAIAVTPPDAAPAVAVETPDAGVAAAPDAGAAAIAPVIKKDAKPDRTRVKPDRTERTERTDRQDPLDPIDNSSTSSGSSDEQKLQAEFYAKTGDGQLRNGDPQAAAASFKKALELDAKNIAAITGLGEVAMQQGLYDAAIKHLKRASKLAKGNAHIHTLLGECYLNSGNSKAAEAAFKRALQLDPDSDRARNGYNEASSRLPPTPDDPE
jgi:serine/threonine-protein kinase